MEVLIVTENRTPFGRLPLQFCLRQTYQGIFKRLRVLSGLHHLEHFLSYHSDLTQSGDYRGMNFLFLSPPSPQTVSSSEF